MLYVASGYFLTAYLSFMPHNVATVLFPHYGFVCSPFKCQALGLKIAVPFSCDSTWVSLPASLLPRRPYPHYGFVSKSLYNIVASPLQLQVTRTARPLQGCVGRSSIALGREDATGSSCSCGDSPECASASSLRTEKATAEGSRLI